MVNSSTSIINRLGSSWADVKAAYRLFSNKKLKQKDMIRCITEDGALHAEGLKHVLCIQDTSEFCYDSNRGHLSSSDPDLGYGSNNTQEYCLYAHPTLMVDAESRMPVGFSDIIMYNHDRSKCRAKRHERHKLSIKDKESYRWAESAINTSINLPQNVRKTMVGDRENDVYGVMCMIRESDCDFLIRSLHNRKTGEDCIHLKEFMSQLTPGTCYDCFIKGHKGRKSRVAKMELRYSKVTLRRTGVGIDNFPETFECYCISVKELESTVPEGEEPIEWRLLTSHTVDTDEQAMECVEWYKCRWYVEELFRICKSEGFCAESSQLNSGDSLKKLIILTMYASLRCMSLKMAYDDKDESVPSDKLFSKDELLLLSLEMKRIHGITPNAKGGNNPFAKNSLPWAAWIIARLGHWNGYESSSGAPGYITMKRGLDYFNQKFETFIYTKDLLLQDVYKE